MTLPGLNCLQALDCFAPVSLEAESSGEVEPRVEGAQCCQLPSQRGPISDGTLLLGDLTEALESPSFPLLCDPNWNAPLLLRYSVSSATEVKTPEMAHDHGASLSSSVRNVGPVGSCRGGAVSCSGLWVPATVPATAWSHGVAQCSPHCCEECWCSLRASRVCVQGGGGGMGVCLPRVWEILD